VQVTKESLGKKGPALSCQISLPGRYLVLMPFLAKRGVSRKIEDEAERKRLKDLLEALPSPAGLGLIVRTAGAERRKTDLLRDLRYLLRVWGAVERDRRRAKAPSPLYLETELVVRTMRDLFTPEIETVWVDTPEAVRKAREFFRLAMPRYESRVKLYDEPEPIFQKFQVERELARVVDPRVPLESGGGIVIDQTEAMVAIDVNSGRFTDAPDAEETAFRINREAAAEIARQIRVRDLGGLIVVDFIDMRLEKHRREVERVFRESLRRDRARLSVLRMSRFCLVEITRQRMRPALASVQTDACPSCGGTGRLVNRDTLAVRILRQLRFHLPKEHVLRAEVHAHRDAAFFLLNEKRSRLLEIEQEAGKRVSVLPREGRFEDFEIRAFGEGDRPVRL
jgi:ribonuclease E